MLVSLQALVETSLELPRQLACTVRRFPLLDRQDLLIDRVHRETQQPVVVNSY